RRLVRVVGVRNARIGAQLLRDRAQVRDPGVDLLDQIGQDRLREQIDRVRQAVDRRLGRRVALVGDLLGGELLLVVGVVYGVVGIQLGADGVVVVDALVVLGQELQHNLHGEDALVVDLLGRGGSAHGCSSSSGGRLLVADQVATVAAELAHAVDLHLVTLNAIVHSRISRKLLLEKVGHGPIGCLLDLGREIPIGQGHPFALEYLGDQHVEVGVAPHDLPVRLRNLLAAQLVLPAPLEEAEHVLLGLLARGHALEHLAAHVPADLPTKTLHRAPALSKTSVWKKPGLAVEIPVYLASPPSIVGIAATYASSASSWKAISSLMIALNV